MSFRSQAKTYLTLIRLPNLFTVPLDPVVGAACATGGINLNICITPIIAVLLLYSAGLILSDYFDREKDALERPERPIPAGDIHPSHALYAGIILLAAGIAAGMTNGFETGMTAAVLAALVLIYSFIHSHYKFTGALVMAGCRALAVLLGAAAAGAVWSAALPASIVFLYVFLLTLSAAGEATRLSLPLFTALCPLFPLSVPFFMAVTSIDQSSSIMAILLLILIFAFTVFSAWICIKEERSIPAHIGLLVRNMIFIQGMWIMLYLSEPDSMVLILLIIAILFMRIMSEIASTKYSSS